MAFLIALALGSISCAQASREPGASIPDSARAGALERDQAERPLIPLTGSPMTLERVALERSELDSARRAAPIAVRPAPARLDPALPEAEPATLPEPSPASPGAPDALSLAPPIARGTPGPVSGGRGGHVTLDVRVDEHGDVSDVLVVEGADSLAIQAAEDAARAMRYHPALLGGKAVAVWTRQAFDVARAGSRR